jgi:hypothetical protein
VPAQRPRSIFAACALDVVGDSSSAAAVTAKAATPRARFPLNIEGS